MRTTLAIGFYCRASKANRYGESPIEMSVCLSGKRVFLNLPRKCAAKALGHTKPDITLKHYAKLEDEAVVEEIGEKGYKVQPLKAISSREGIITAEVI